MAVFRPAEAVCKLNFDDKYIYTLPLHEDTAEAIDKAAERFGKLAPKDKAGVDDAYDTACDVIDELLGSGAAADIMSLYKNPGTLELWAVLLFILEEWKAAYSAEVEKIKKTAQLPNRAERRGRR